MLQIKYLKFFLCSCDLLIKLMSRTSISTTEVQYCRYGNMAIYVSMF